MKRVNYILVLLVSIFAITLGSFQVNADESGIPFRADLIIPQGQDEGIEDYVSITTDNSISSEIEFSLVNNENRDKEIIVEVVDSYTSPGGVVQYSTKGPEGSEITDENYKMSKYLTLDENIVSLKAGDSKNIKLNLNVENLDGVILGGVSFKEKAKDKVDSESSEGDFTIESEINIIIGVKVDFGTKELVEMELGEPFVEVMPALHVVRLPMELKNTAPKKFHFDYKVEKESSVIFEDKMEIDFASRSKAQIRLPWRAESIEGGATYTLTGTLTYNDLDGQEKSIDVNKTFEYKVNNYDEIIENIFSPTVEGGTNYTMLILILIGVASLVVLTLLIRQNMRKCNYYSDNNNAPEFIVEGGELYSQLTKGKPISKESKYKHVYKREKIKYGDYELIKSKRIK